MKKYRIIIRTLFFFVICFSGYGFPTSNVSSSFLEINNSLEDANTTIGYNILTGTEDIEYFSKSSIESSFQTFAPPFLGNHDEEEIPEVSFVFPPDDRVKITSTSSFPWSTICKIYITAADETRWIGSGAMIDAYHVLTCGHLVYLHENGGWASQVEVIPGMRGSNEPFGHAYSTYMRTYSGWIQNEMEEHDWAVLTLDRTIGYETGWLGRMTADSSDLIYTGMLHTAGYPGDLDFGEYMYYVSDMGASVDEYNHWYWMDSAGGQSGSPVWTEVNGSGYILSIHAYEYIGGVYANFGTRLDQDKFDQLNAWLAADTPPVEDSNRWDPIITIVIVISLAIGIIAVGLIIRKVVRRQSLDLKPYKEDIMYQDSKMETISTTQEKPLFFCPMCGKGIFRDTQRFCVNCGYSFLNSGSEE